MEKKLHLMLLYGLILLGVCGCGKQQEENKEYEGAPNSDIVIKYDDMFNYNGGDKTVVGNIKNNTDTSYDYFEISFVYYNREGRRAGFCRTLINSYSSTLYARSDRDFELLCTGSSSEMYNFEFESFSSNGEKLDLNIELIKE